MEVRVGPKEGQVPKNWCFWTVVLEKTFESPLDSKEIKWINSKGNQSWIFIGMTDAEAAILWSLDVKSWLTGKDRDAGKDWGQEEKGATEDEMGWHQWLNGQEFEQTQGDNEGQGSLVCSSPQSHRELDMTEQLNNRKISTWIIFSSYFIFSTMQTKIFKITYIICIIFLLYDAIWENVGRQANDTARKPLKLFSM